ncbi:MAG: cupin domain-containing protein [Pseudorhodoplanes sp.]
MDFIERAPALNDEEYYRDIVEAAAIKEPSLFELKIQIPTQGRSNIILSATDEMSVILKAYASGGENTLHAHVHEDHAFIVMQGSATFIGKGDREIATLTKYQGIMLPRGALYRFVAGEGEPLVLLRVGTAAINPDIEHAFSRKDADGQDNPSFSKKNNNIDLRYDKEIWFGPRSG